MRKLQFIPLLAAVMLLTACGKDAQASEQQTEYDRACSLIDTGEYDEAESILIGLGELEEAKDKLLELQQLKQLAESLNRYSGNWIRSDFSGNDLVLSPDGTGTLKKDDDTVSFSFLPFDSGISTDYEAFSELPLNSTDSIRFFSIDGYDFYNECDITALPMPAVIEITAENWDNYFDIITECFAKTWREYGDMDYYSEILFFTPKAEIRERMSPYHGFDLSFCVNYEKKLYYIEVDSETFMPLSISGISEDLGNYEVECVLNNQALQRIESGNILYSDGFAHQSLRDAEYKRYFRYYDIAENISVSNVTGCLYLIQ